MSSKHRQFDTLVGALTNDLFRYACWLCGDRNMAQDLVQETLLRAWRYMGSLKDTRAIKGWLITTMRREHARLYERKRFDYADVDLFSLPDGDADDPEVSADRQALRRRIGALPAEYQEPLVLQVILGCSVREIATAMDLTESAVTMRLSRARKKLLDSHWNHAAGMEVSR